MDFLGQIKKKIEDQANQSIQRIDDRFSSFIANERANTVPCQEDIDEALNKFLHITRSTIKDEFSKEVFAFIENPEAYWGINPVFFKSNRDLEELMKKGTPELNCPAIKFYHLPNGPSISVSPNFLSRNIYRILYAIIPIFGLIVLFLAILGISSIFPNLKF